MSRAERHIRLPSRARAKGHPQAWGIADLRQVEGVVGALDVHGRVHRNGCARRFAQIGTDDDLRI